MSTWTFSFELNVKILLSKKEKNRNLWDELIITSRNLSRSRVVDRPVPKRVEAYKDPKQNEMKLSNKTRHRLSTSRRYKTDAYRRFKLLILSLLNPRIFPLITKISLNSLKRNESTSFINLSFLQSQELSIKIEKSIYKIIISINFTDDFDYSFSLRVSKNQNVDLRTKWNITAACKEGWSTVRSICRR